MLLALRLFWGFLRYFFREVGDLFFYFRGIRGLRENLQVFIVGFDGFCVLMFFFVSIAQEFPRRCQSGLIVGRFHETVDGRVIRSLI